MKQQVRVTGETFRARFIQIEAQEEQMERNLGNNLMSASLAHVVSSNYP